MTAQGAGHTWRLQDASRWQTSWGCDRCGATLLLGGDEEPGNVQQQLTGRELVRVDNPTVGTLASEPEQRGRVYGDEGFTPYAPGRRLKYVRRLTTDGDLSCRDRERMYERLKDAMQAPGPGAEVPPVDQVEPWAPGVVYRQGTYVRPQAPSGSVYVLRTGVRAQPSGNTEPRWTGRIGEYVADGHQLWECVRAGTAPAWNVSRTITTRTLARDVDADRWATDANAGLTAEYLAQLDRAQAAALLPPGVAPATLSAAAMAAIAATPVARALRKPGESEYEFAERLLGAGRETRSRSVKPAPGREALGLPLVDREIVAAPAGERVDEDAARVAGLELDLPAAPAQEDKGHGGW